MSIKDPREISRAMATQLGCKTLELLDKGSVTVLDVSHDLRPGMEHSRNGTVYYPPDSDSLSSWASTSSLNAYTTSINIQEISTIDGALQFAQHGERPGVLNFASAKHPGGGWLNGARAQEESLTRSSTLYSSLTTSVASQFYELHNTDPKGGYYSNAIIFSPRVVVFREMGGNLIAPFEIDVITSPAVNAGTVRERVPREKDPEPVIRQVMKERMARILYAFEINGIKDLVLGSFGTGAFKNRVDTVASIWAELLLEHHARFKTSFRHVIFAILGQETIEKFRESFVVNE